MNKCISGRKLTEEVTLNDEKLAAFADTLKPAHVLVFATGSDKMPARGLQPNGKLVYRHDDSQRLPESSTCCNQVILSCTTTSATFQDFALNMLRALFEGDNRFPDN